MEGGTYYSAYPEASTRMCKQALAVDGALADLVEQSKSLSPEAFKAAWERFLTAQQGNL